MADKSEFVGDGILAKNASWTFGEGVARNFSSHVRRSVPFYIEGHDLICGISDFFVKNDSVCYELGTSVGELIAKLSSHHSNKKSVEWVGVDIEEEMIQKAKENNSHLSNVSFVTDNIKTYPYKKADLFISYYTLQFVHPKERQEIFDTIYKSLNWGGALLLFEKVRASDARFQDMMTSLYNDYKLEQGFSTDEVISKARSLKGVLEPFSTQGNIDLMKRAGFVDIMTVMKYICFEGFLAIK
ncbi:putative tRNA (cmo5U34)-methyltransferase [Leptospira kirschneri str. JB]|uniref:methyltransferase domain-containing protein n=1 Tax=Leptospira kirschneri TaxID=29507 RepID=UPI0002BF844C|nr:methyltransferase domain-containing protein [Leptospira kirschneri]EMJ93463.1 putative tRNA (cmo5U34)-methyltransferase [Leptospira kirschneri str. JB]